jgi:uncharacterized membrane protein HdeD (DUF308 family)
MLKKFNKFMWISIASCVLFLIIGIIFLGNPETSFKVVSIIFSVLLIVTGIYLIVDYSGKVLFTSFLTTGILSLILGVVLLLNPDALVVLVPIVVGTWMITSSIVDIELSLSLKKIGYSSWLLPTIMAIIAILCGVLMIVYPHSGTIALTTFFGILLIVYSMAAIIDLFVFKKNVNDIVKEIEE